MHSTVHRFSAHMIGKRKRSQSEVAADIPSKRLSCRIPLTASNPARLNATHPAPTTMPRSLKKSDGRQSPSKSSPETKILPPNQTTTLEKTQTQSSISHHGSTANTHYLRTADFRTSTQHFESCDAHRSALCLSMDVQALM
jgi:hypothetical protein